MIYGVVPKLRDKIKLMWQFVVSPLNAMRYIVTKCNNSKDFIIAATDRTGMMGEGRGIVGGAWDVLVNLTPSTTQF